MLGGRRRGLCGGTGGVLVERDEEEEEEEEGRERYHLDWDVRGIE